MNLNALRYLNKLLRTLLVSKLMKTNRFNQA